MRLNETIEAHLINRKSNYINITLLYSMAFLFGCIGALSFAPLFYIICSFAAFSGLMLLLDYSRSNKESFFIGWLFGTGYFAVGLYWISISLFVDINKYFYLLPFSAILLPSLIALYIAITTLISAVFRLNEWSKVLVFALNWTIIELLRSKLFTGFPWNLQGYVWCFSDNFIQITSILGIYSLSFLSILLFCTPYLILTKNMFNLLFVIVIIVCIAAIWWLGKERLNKADIDDDININIRLVQANIGQRAKWSKDALHNNLITHINLSNAPSDNNIDYIIWSESALPYLIKADNKPLDYLATINPNSNIITGAVRAELTNQGHIHKLWNSLFLINSTDTKIIDYYDKSLLVPFGEYIPFAGFLPLDKITHGSIDFSKGKLNKLLGDNYKFLPLICYEIIFPFNIRNTLERASWIVNITNDSWFGNSSGPYQHLHMGRVRAVEYGIPIVRAANTGISAVIDGYGRIRSSLGLSQRGIIDSKIPKLLPETFYSKYGDSTILLIIVLLYSLIIFKIFKER